METGTFCTTGVSVTAVPLDVGTVRAAEVDQHPAASTLRQLGMTGAGIDVALRVERDFTPRDGGPKRTRKPAANS